MNEIDSGPRITALARRRKKYGIEPGVALDLTTTDEIGKAWDFNDPRQRRRAEQLLDEQQPLLLIGSPMCTAFSQLQQIGVNRAPGTPGWRDPAKMEENRARAMVHMRFTCHLYHKQLVRGGYFVHKHPGQADSWTKACIQEVWAKAGVKRIMTDQCLFGQATESGDPVKKPTGFLTNSIEIAAALDKRCRGRGGACRRREGGSHAHALERSPRGLRSTMRSCATPF